MEQIIFNKKAYRRPEIRIF